MERCTQSPQTEKLKQNKVVLNNLLHFVIFYEKRKKASASFKDPTTQGKQHLHLHAQTVKVLQDPNLRLQHMLQSKLFQEIQPLTIYSSAHALLEATACFQCRGAKDRRKGQSAFTGCSRTFGNVLPYFHSPIQLLITGFSRNQSCLTKLLKSEVQSAGEVIGSRNIK